MNPQLTETDREFLRAFRHCPPREFYQHVIKYVAESIELKTPVKKP